MSGTTTQQKLVAVIVAVALSALLYFEAHVGPWSIFPIIAFALFVLRDLIHEVQIHDYAPYGLIAALTAVVLFLDSVYGAGVLDVPTVVVALIAALESYQHSTNDPAHSPVAMAKDVAAQVSSLDDVALPPTPPA